MSAIYYTAYSVFRHPCRVFIDIYRFSELEIGISYLAIGVAVAVGGYPNGKFLERNYRAIAKADWLHDQQSL
jgi:predicted MFS family arabinose efflux permease